MSLELSSRIAASASPWPATAVIFPIRPNMLFSTCRSASETPMSNVKMVDERAIRRRVAARRRGQRITRSTRPTQSALSGEGSRGSSTEAAEPRPAGPCRRGSRTPVSGSSGNGGHLLSSRTSLAAIAFKCSIMDSFDMRQPSRQFCPARRRVPRNDSTPAHSAAAPANSCRRDIRCQRGVARSRQRGTQSRTTARRLSPHQPPPAPTGAARRTSCCPAGRT